APLAGIVPVVRRQRRNDGAADAVGADDRRIQNESGRPVALIATRRRAGRPSLERRHFVRSWRGIGYGPIPAHWGEPYFTKRSTLASTKWLFCSISCRD